MGSPLIRDSWNRRYTELGNRSDITCPTPSQAVRCFGLVIEEVLRRCLIRFRLFNGASLKTFSGSNKGSKPGSTLFKSKSSWLSLSAEAQEVHCWPMASKTKSHQAQVLGPETAGNWAELTNPFSNRSVSDIALDRSKT